MTVDIGTYYEENRKKLLNRIRGRGVRQDLVEDCLQEAFARSMKYISAFDETKGTFEAWFVRILKNTISDIKTEDIRQGMSNDKVEETTEDPCFDSLMCGNIEEEIYKRKQPAKDILYLHFVRKMYTEDIKGILGMNKKAINQTLFRFKRDMKEKYGSK